MKIEIKRKLKIVDNLPAFTKITILNYAKQAENGFAEITLAAIGGSQPTNAVNLTEGAGGSTLDKLLNEVAGGGSGTLPQSGDNGNATGATNTGANTQQIAPACALLNSKAYIFSSHFEGLAKALAPNGTVGGLESDPSARVIDVPILDQPSGNTCGPTSVTMLLRYLGVSADIWDINRRVPSTSQNPSNNVAEFQRRGLYAKGTNAGTRSLIKRQIDAGRPVVVHTYFTAPGHVVLVVGYSNTGFYINDPNGYYLGYQGGYNKSRSGKSVLVPYSKLGHEWRDGGIWISTASKQPFSL